MTLSSWNGFSQESKIMFIALISNRLFFSPTSLTVSWICGQYRFGTLAETAPPYLPREFTASLGRLPLPLSYLMAMRVWKTEWEYWNSFKYIFGVFCIVSRQGNGKCVCMSKGVLILGNLCHAAAYVTHCTSLPPGYLSVFGFFFNA